MRAIVCLVLGVALTGNAMALETSAGADNVNTSQVGINAKIEASNAITTATINQVLTCGKSGQLYNSTNNTCVTVDEPLAKKIAACSTNKQFYNQNTSACQDSAPDLTGQLNTTNTNLGNAQSLLNKIAACNDAKQFYSSATGGCVSGAASVTLSSYDITVGSPGTNLGRHIFCASEGSWGDPEGGTKQVWFTGGPDANGKYQWYAKNVRRNGKTPWSPEFWVICED